MTGLLSKIDSYLLSNASSCQVVVKNNALHEEGLLAYQEVRKLYSTHLQEPALELFKLAGIGKTTEGIKDQKYRGDVRCWLTPSLCSRHQLLGVKALIAKIVKECEGNLKSQHNLNGHYSIQASLYPGDGAHYVRHVDAGTHAEASDVQRTKQTVEAQGSAAYPGKRRLTFIYYLNEPHGAGPANNTGGDLRVYGIPHGSGKAGADTETESYMDIEPVLGTLVVFRSDTVEHEVLPTYRDRWALTLWAYAHDEKDSGDQGCAAPAPLPPVSAAASLACHPPLKASGVCSALSPSISKPPPLRVSRGDDATHSGCETIFVSIISYRDSELPPTVRDLFASAAHPERLFVGIVYQLHSSDEPRCRLQPEQLDQFGSGREKEKGAFYAAHVRTLSLPHMEAKGPIFARHLAASLYAGEQFALQIDSHMRFRGNWDAHLVGLLGHVEGCEGTTKAVLSTYPLGYHLPDQVPQDTRPTVLMPSKFDDHGFLRQEGKVLDGTDTDGDSNSCSSSGPMEYFRSALWAAGFSFSRGSLLLKVPYSPLLPHLFFGEEVSMAARLHTHGYDLFCPAEAVLYHLYSRQHRPTFQELQQQPQPTSSAEKPASSESAEGGIAALKSRSMRVVQHLLLGPAGAGCVVEEREEEVGGDEAFRSLLALNEMHFGLGTERTLDSFWEKLALLGVSRPTRDATSSATVKAGSVVRDDAARLAFLKVGDTGGALPFRFTQTGMSSTAPPPDVLLSTPTSEADQRQQQSDARLMALLSSAAGIGNRIQRFL